MSKLIGARKIGTDISASGVWALSEQSALVRDSLWPKTGDPNLLLLLRFNGTHNSTVFVDEGSFNCTVTPVGTAYISTTQSKFGGSSLYLGGSGSYLQVSGMPAIGLSDFTIELFSYQTVLTDFRHFVNFVGATTSISFFVYNSKLYFYTLASNKIVGVATITVNVFKHCALVRYQNVTKLYYHGVQDGNDYSDINNYDIAAGGTLRIGEGVSGYIDSIRIRKTAVYLSNFTPPISEF